MSFNHPLARDAQVWSTGGKKGKVKRLLVIITALELDEDHPKHKKDKVTELSKAASEWIDENPQESEDFILMSRPKKWIG